MNLLLKIRAKYCFLRANGILDDIIRALSRGEKFPEKNKDHELTGNWAGHRECHIQPDWLLLYQIEDDMLVLTQARSAGEIILNYLKRKAAVA